MQRSNPPVDKLVLMVSDGFASPGFEHGKPPEVPATFKPMRYTMPKSFLRMRLAPAYANAATMTDALLGRYYDLMLAPGVRQAMIAKMQQSVLQDPLPQLRGITAPPVLFWGEKDTIIPIANMAATDYTAAPPTSTLVMLSGAGHLPHVEAPVAVLQGEWNKPGADLANPHMQSVDLDPRHGSVHDACRFSQQTLLRHPQPPVCSTLGYSRSWTLLDVTRVGDAA